MCLEIRQYSGYAFWGSKFSLNIIVLSAQTNVNEYCSYIFIKHDSILNWTNVIRKCIQIRNSNPRVPGESKFGKK